MAEINELGTLLGLMQQGFTPDQARQQLDEARAMQMAKMTGREMTRMGLIQGAQDLRRGLMSALGQESQDPTLQMASRIRQLGSQFNTATSEGLMQFANALQQVNPDMARQVAMQAQKMQLDEATLGLRRAQTEEVTSRASREARLADEASKAQKGRAAALKKRYPDMSEEEADTISLDAKVSGELLKPEKKTETKVETTVVTADGKVRLINKQTGEVIREIGLAGKSLEESLGTGLGVLGRNLTEAMKKESGTEGEFAAKDYNALGSSVAAGISSKRNIDTLNNALKNAFTGSLADTKTAITKAFDAIGVPIDPRFKEAASNTELIGAMGTRYVFPLVKNFPGSLAAKELDRLEKTAPSALQQPETIRRLMDLLKVDIAENEFTYNKAKQYKTDNKGSTVGFNAADARIDFQNKLTALRNKVNVVKAKKSMTPQEKAEIDSLKKELGVE